jgi:HEAT repeat protein
MFDNLPDTPLNILADPKSNYRTLAIWFFRDHPDPRAFDALLKVIREDKNASDRALAAQALGRLGDPRALDSLITMLAGDKDAVAREGAAQTLRMMNDARAADTLLAAMKDPSHPVRFYAAQSLVALGKTHPHILDTLMAILISPSRTTSLARCIVDALLEAPDPRAAETLIRVIQEGDKRFPPRTDIADRKKAYSYSRKTEKEAQVRAVAASVLGALQEIRAIEPLTRIVNNLHEDKYLRECAINSLGQIGGPGVFRTLIAALGGNRSVNVAALALGNLGDTRAIEPLREAAKDEFSRIVILPVLRGLGYTEIMDDLLDMLRKQDPYGLTIEERAAPAIAAKELFNIADPRSIPHLVDAFANPNPFVRLYAVWGLLRMGDMRGIPVLAELLQRSPNRHLLHLTFDAVREFPSDPRLRDALYALATHQETEYNTGAELDQRRAWIELAYQGDERARSPLERLLNTPYASQEVVAALRVLKNTLE